VLDDGAVPGGDAGLEEIAAQFHQPPMGAFLVGLHQAGVARHVDRQDGAQPPMQASRRRHKLSHARIPVW
jgi:hypothetical protein